MTSPRALISQVDCRSVQCHLIVLCLQKANTCQQMWDFYPGSRFWGTPVFLQNSLSSLVCLTPFVGFEEYCYMFLKVIFKDLFCGENM